MFHVPCWAQQVNGWCSTPCGHAIGSSIGRRRRGQRSREPKLLLLGLGLARRRREGDDEHRLDGVLTVAAEQAGVQVEVREGGGVRGWG